MSEQSKKQMTYADAGVDIDAGNRAVELMKESVRANKPPNPPKSPITSGR